MEENIKLQLLLRKATNEIKEAKGKSKILEETVFKLQQENEQLREIIGPVSARKLQPLKLTPTGKACAILGLGDWHRAEVIDPETIDGKNEYNFEIGTRRIDRTFKGWLELVECQRRISNIKSAVILCLGDFLNGYLRPENLETNSLSPTQEVIQVEKDLYSGIKFLVEHGGFDEIGVAFVGGSNHDRNTDKPRITSSWMNSYDWLIANNVSSRDYGKKKINWSLSKGYFAKVDIGGYIIRAHHGDALKFHGGIGGISAPVNRAIASWNQAWTPNLDIFGHFHAFMLQWPSWICCPSLCGYNSFAQFIHATYNEPGQLFAVIDNSRGLVDCKPVFVE